MSANSCPFAVHRITDTVDGGSKAGNDTLRRFVQLRCVKNFKSFLLYSLKRNLFLIPTGAASVALSLHVNDGSHTDLPVNLLFLTSNYFANLEINH